MFEHIMNALFVKFYLPLNQNNCLHEATIILIYLFFEINKYQKIIEIKYNKNMMKNIE